MTPTERKARIATLEEAARRAERNAPVNIVIVNDPEDMNLLREYRVENLDQSRALEIGPTTFPGPRWYARYQQWAREGRPGYPPVEPGDAEGES